MLSQQSCCSWAFSFRLTHWLFSLPQMSDVKWWQMVQWNVKEWSTPPQPHRLWITQGTFTVCESTQSSAHKIHGEYANGNVITHPCELMAVRTCTQTCLWLLFQPMQIDFSRFRSDFLLQPGSLTNYLSPCWLLLPDTLATDGHPAQHCQDRGKCSLCKGYCHDFPHDASILPFSRVLFAKLPMSSWGRSCTTGLNVFCTKTFNSQCTAAVGSKNQCKMFQRWPAKVFRVWRNN